MLVFLSLYVMLSILLSILIRKFVPGLFGHCPCLCTISHRWQHAAVVHMSLQADGKVAFEEIPVFGLCRPACHDSSLYLFILVLFLDGVVLPQVFQQLIFTVLTTGYCSLYHLSMLLHFSRLDFFCVLVCFAMLVTLCCVKSFERSNGLGTCAKPYFLFWLCSNVLI